ncbi:Solute carrier family 25 member 36 [Porphyridium purpureum]|uniref:Solute carrier family 25 member 36 n=1 Tax=Porphyridium purpureum TaxID=35688 RepID=A0A5J4YTV0_PORPP|nr:Solute carrier family 25 member 36 [Porphyridium purpureum]|eukprot:POR0977..scf229_5
MGGKRDGGGKRMVNQQLASFLAGGLAGAVSSTITCPLEVVKTKLQASTHASRDAVRVVAADILRAEGIRGFFRGWIPTVIGILPTRSIYFWAYSSTKHALSARLGDTAALHVLSAALAGVFSNTFTNPIWALKTRMQLQAGAGGYSGYGDAIRTIWRTEGISGFFRGLSASYWGVSEGAIHFVVYEKLKKAIHARNAKRALAQDASAAGGASGTASPSSVTSLEYLVTAGMSKLLASALTYPHEVVRTRMREIPAPGQLPKYRGMIQSLILIGKEEGRAGLYAGMGTHLARVVPNTAIMFLTFETTIKLVQKYNNSLKIQARSRSDTKQVVSFGERTVAPRRSGAISRTLSR